MTALARTAAFFDLDGTLITVNSAALWMRAERRRGRLTLPQMLEGALYLLLYRVHAVDMGKVMRKALRTVQGELEETIRRLTYEWFERDVRPFVAPGARAVVEGHRRQGHRLVLLTSSSLYASECADREFGFDDVICTRYEVADGRFTGEVAEPICYAEGKVELAERLAVERDIDLDRSFFYTDSCTDLPMLERVGAPRVVHPDFHLRLVARRRGWPILDWR